ncbi:MAG: DUF5615 family PIN-like protein [Phycisphaerae bacterium]
MRLRECALLTDENIHPDVVSYLRQEGFDVFDVKESNLAGTSDVALIRLGRSQSRLIITHDRDFGGLAIATQEPIWGILYLRPGHLNASFTVGTIRTLLEVPIEFNPPVIIVAQRAEGSLRIRIRNINNDD